MMCDDCGVRPANFLLKAVTDDGVHEKNLCPVCMAKYQRRIPGLDFSNLAGILSGILETRKNTAREESISSSEYDGLVCPECGMTYAEFRKDGRMGCAACYQAFRQPLDSLLLKVHGNLQHAGKFKVFPIYHPAAAIYDRTKQSALEQDFATLGELLRQER